MVDRYTKAVLTVIAVALVGLVLKDTPPVSKAFAQFQGPVHVVVDQLGSYVVTLPLPVRVQP